MACELLLEGLLEGSLDISVVSHAIETFTPIKAGNSSIALSDFIPYFLEYIHTKLSPVSSNGSGKLLYHSPRQHQLKKSLVSNTPKNKRKEKSNVCISLTYASSSPAKPIRIETTPLKHISPIKKQSNNSKNKARRQKTTVLKQSSIQNTSTSFELSNMDDFPSIGMSSTSKSKNPRRITTTPVSKLQTLSKENSYLEESSFEVNSTEGSDFNKVFSDSNRFMNGSSTNDTNSFENGFNGTFDDAFKRFNIESEFLLAAGENKKEINGNNNLIKEAVSRSNVKNKKSIDLLVLLYLMIFSRGIITNYAVEFHFLFAALVYPENTKISSPVENVSGCVYFVCECLKHLRKIIVLFDSKTNLLLNENDRVREFIDRETILFLEHNKKKDRHSFGLSQLSIKSPMTGIPFQVEFDNRKSFQSDQLFYLFSKKRDLFYELIRTWEQNRHDPEWDMKRILSKHVIDIIRPEGSSKIFYPLARLFVAQLLEMCRSSFGSRTDENGANISDNIILELKSKNPSKFQSLQNRFTKPSLTTDPCPKPNFTTEEYFFKEFISIADSYKFNKCLIHVVLNLIDTLNSQSFGLDESSIHLNRSDIAESTWHEIKLVITDLRLLGKFLGYILFLPYRDSNDAKMLSINEDCNIFESIDLLPIMKKAAIENRLIVTIPWIVEFFSMADKSVFKQKLFQKPFLWLIKLYGSLNFAKEMFSLLYLALTLHIGWLLEQYQIESLDFFKVVLESDEVFSTNHEGSGIDNNVDVDKAFIYELCPYLNDVKKPLLDYAKGINSFKPVSYRKITTLKTSDIVFTDPSINLRLQLIDSFTRYLPTQTADCLKFITERHYSNIKNTLTSKYFQQQARETMDKMKALLKMDSVSEEMLNMTALQVENQDVYSEYFEKSLHEVTQKCQNHLQSYLDNNVASSVKTLLPDESTLQLVETCVKVVKHNVRNKIYEWFQLNKDTYSQMVDNIYQKHLKSMLKTKLEMDRSKQFNNII